MIKNIEDITSVAIYGDGSDGAITVNSGTFSSGPITNNVLTRDGYFTTLTIDSTYQLDTAGYRIFYSVELVNNGTILWVPVAGANGTYDSASAAAGAIGITANVGVQASGGAGGYKSGRAGIASGAGDGSTGATGGAGGAGYSLTGLAWAKINGQLMATITETGHNMVSGYTVNVSSSSDTGELPNGLYYISVTGLNTFQVNTGVTAVGAKSGTCNYTGDISGGVASFTILHWRTMGYVPRGVSIQALNGGGGGGGGAAGSFNTLKKYAGGGSGGTGGGILWPLGKKTSGAGGVKALGGAGGNGAND